LFVGFLPPTLVFSLNANAATELGMNSVTIPAWLFIGVWLIAYPSMGIAAWKLWKRRGEVDVCVPIGVLIAGFVITLTFWLTNSLRMTATLDLVNLILAWTTMWIFSRYAREAAAWLLPWAIWMPITLSFKIAAMMQS
jgi:tryptophan-rich sensory protein